MSELEKIVAFGHEKVKGTHKTTIEITKENFLTYKGDCIIGVKSEKACFYLNENTKKILRTGKKIRFILEVNGKTDVVNAFGSPDLILTNKTSLVIRKSEFVDDRTVAIKADKAAKDLNRSLIEELKNPNAKLIIRVIE